MKLAASLFCIAALSLVGCADVETTGGGQGEGIIPAKTLSLDPQDVEESFHPAIAGMQQVPGREPADYICMGCEIVAYRVPDDTGGIDEVRLVKDQDVTLCRIYLNDNEVVLDDCGMARP